MTRRTGLRTLRDIAHRVCRIVASFTPILQLVYGSNIPLMLAIEAVNTACGNLVQIADEELETGA